MSKINNILKDIDGIINSFKPTTMDGLIDIVHKVAGAGSYGTSFTIVKDIDTFKVIGVRVNVTGKKLTHVLPSKNSCYPVKLAMDHFIKAGWPVVFAELIAEY